MRFYITCVLSMCVIMATAQSYTTPRNASKKALKFYKQGIENTKKRTYPDAIKAYSKAIKKSDNFLKAYLYRADSYYALEQFELAEKDFEYILTVDETFNPKVLYTLGVLECKMEKYDEGIAHFEKFLAIGNPKSTLIPQTEKRLINARFAANAVKNPVEFEPKNLGPGINTDQAEYLPTITADNQTLIYTRKVGRQEDFFVSENGENGWKPSYDMGEPINTDDNEGAQTISADGKTLVYTVCNRRNDFGSCDLYIAEMKNGQWQRPRNIGPPISTSAWESQPALSADGKTLYFTSNRKGGKGGKDIWVSERKENGSWEKPRNLSFNTKGIDGAPFIHADNETLYFMSNGYPGMGNTDIFVIKKQDKEWSTPQNLGYPINTPSNEGSLFVSLDGQTAYFASDRKDGYGLVDIYSFQLYDAVRPTPATYVKATIYDADTKKEIEASVDIFNLGKNKIHETVKSKGSFLVCLPVGTDYALNVDKKGYLFHSENFALTESSTILEPLELSIYLQKIPEDIAVTTDKPAKVLKSIVLKNIFFESGSAELLQTSTTELNKLLSFMQENPTMTIQISGHTDNVGKDEDNLILSQKRAESVVNYLTENGIAQNRLVAKGYGESVPVASNDTEEGRSANRRTEFIILKR